MLQANTTQRHGCAYSGRSRFGQRQVLVDWSRALSVQKIGPSGGMSHVRTVDGSPPITRGDAMVVGIEEGKNA